MNIRTLVLSLSLLCFAAPTVAYAQDSTAPDVVEVVEADVAVDATAEVDAAPSDESEASGESSGRRLDTIPVTYEDAEDAFIALLAAGKAGEWAIFAGLLLMLLIWVARKFVFPRVEGPAVAWATAGVGTLAYIAVALAVGTPVLSAIVTGFMTGAMASGLWELIGRATLGRSD